jgi:flagellar export protein FliJ
LIDSQRYEFLLLAQVEALKQQAVRLTEETERRREALVAADREVRTLEKLREKQKLEHQQEQQRLEVKFLDEVAARGHSGELA